MSSRTVVAQATWRGRKFSAEIEQDIDCPESPRDWDNVGTLVCFGYTNESDAKDKDELLEGLLSDVRPDLDTSSWIESLQDFAITTGTGAALPRVRGAKEIDDLILAEISKKYVILPVYIYNHSGLAISTSTFSCRWDSGQAGWIYASKEDILNNWGGKYLTKALRRKAVKLLEGEIATLNQFYQGDVYGKMILEDGEETDSCWGYFGLDYVKAEAKSELFHAMPFVDYLWGFFPPSIKEQEAQNCFHRDRIEETLRLAVQEDLITCEESRSIRKLRHELIG